MWIVIEKNLKRYWLPLKESRLVLQPVQSVGQKPLLPLVCMFPMMIFPKKNMKLKLLDENSVDTLGVTQQSGNIRIVKIIFFLN